MDSTDRERISVTREELYKMLAHEVSRILALDVCWGDISVTFFTLYFLRGMLFQIFGKNYLATEFVILTLSNSEVYLKAVECGITCRFLTPFILNKFGLEVFLDKKI